MEATIGLQMSFTKFFDVKSPLGISQKDSAKNEYQSIGVDIYMPKPTMGFVEALIASNADTIVSGLVKDRKTNLVQSFAIQRKSETLLRYTFEGEYHIFNDIQIPSGIGLLIPQGFYVDLRSKSSNFKNGFTSITGLIDEDYTYGMGIQIVLLNGATIILKPDEKVSQLVLKKSYEIHHFNEIPLTNWDKLKDVNDRRKSRSGGFGHTGKFDK
jgi:dUTPase